MKTIEEITKEALGEEYGLFIWAEKLLSRKAMEIKKETGMPYLMALDYAHDYNKGASKIYEAGINKIRELK